MSRIFISHSSRDNRQATALRAWLVKQDPPLANEIFLDTDSDTGLRPGERWKNQLISANSRCEAVICLLSKNWESSSECRTEYRTAENMGKQILCARLEHDTGEYTGEWQHCDLFTDGLPEKGVETIAVRRGAPVNFAKKGLHQLREAIRGAGIGAENFVWPPPSQPERAAYRGWEPFEELDAGVFFGRDAENLRGLDKLRGMRTTGIDSLFVVLGPSGSGKSSFLRAGLLPRLRREDRHFVLLDITRPERRALTGDTGLARAIHQTRRRLGLRKPPLGDIENACTDDPARVRALLAEIRQAAAERLGATEPAAAPPTLVLPLDQAEELFSSDAGPEAAAFLRLITHLAQPDADGQRLGLIAAATIRTDRYEVMQSAPELAGLTSEVFDDLKPMPPNQFREVITGLAARASAGGHRLSFAPVLVNRLLEEAAEGGDALPLLALTLRRLYDRYGDTGEITLADYEAMGGMRRVVQNVVDEVVAGEPEQRAGQLAELRAAFIPWLATIADNDEPVRRVARWSDLPEASRPLIGAFVEKRLLVKDQRGGQVVVEVALESLLRQWDQLAGWLADQRHNLRAADDLHRTAAAWRSSGHDTAWLLTGTRLADAETLAATPEFQQRLAGVRDFLAASREQAQANLRAATAHRLIAQAQGMLAGTQPGGDARAFQQILAAYTLTTPDDRVLYNALYNAVVQRASTLKIITGHTDTVESVAFSPDGHRLASASKDAAVRLWNADTGQPIGNPLTGHGDLVVSVAFSPDGHRLASASKDTTVRLWNADTGEPIGAPLTGHTGGVRGVAFSPDGHHLASTGMDGTVRLWDVDTGEPIGAPLTGHTDAVFGVAFSPDGHRLASTGDDTTVRLWNTDTGQPIGNPLTGHPAPVRGVAFSPDGRRLATGSYDTTVRLWNTDTGQPIGNPLTGHFATVRGVAFSLDGHRLATGSYDTTVRLWNTDTGQPIGNPLTGHTNAVTDVAFSPDGHRLASASWDSTVRLWNTDTGQPLGNRFTGGHTDAVESVAFSPDGHRLASASNDAAVRLWDADTGQPIGDPLTGHTATVESVAFSPDGHRLASTGMDGTVRLWDADTREPIGAPLTGHTGGVRGVAFSPDGHRLASASKDATVRLWDADTGQPIGAPLTGHTDAVFGVAFSPDGHRLASASKDATVRLWNADTGRPLGNPLAGHTNGVTDVVFSPDGHCLASASWDSTVRLWNTDTGQPIGDQLTGHTGGVNSVAFSPDGHRLASASGDSTVRLWNTDTGQPIGDPLTGHTGQVNSVAFSPDGYRLASASKDATVRVWPAWASPDMLCAKLTANMSPQQWRDWVSPDIEYEEVCPNLPTPDEIPGARPMSGVGLWPSGPRYSPPPRM